MMLNHEEEEKTKLCLKQWLLAWRAKLAEMLFVAPQASWVGLR